jgi:N-acetylglutamate synthase-like GNAT family acetyltransferase
LAFTARQATEHDRAILKEIIDLSFPRFFRFFAAHSLDSEEGKVLVIEHDQTVVCFVKLTEFDVANGKYGCVLWLAVHPNNRREGSGSALIKVGAEDLKQRGSKVVFASVQRRNKASLATFRKEGFERVDFVGLWRLFGWRTFQFYSDIWFAPSEVVLMQC